jgi:hypothetical protein
MSAPTADPKRFRMTVSLNVLNHLGINLYSNIPAVLSELVANAYDADAAYVSVDIDDANDVITVTDDGVGMTAAEVNSRFLYVGYVKRLDTTNPLATITPKGRKPMGRKGIGKLSVFSIAREVEVHTARDGERSGFIMRLDDIQHKIGSGGGDSVYHPEEIPAEDVLVTSGTKLILRDLKNQANKTAAHLKKRLARRFSLASTTTGFSIAVDGQAIGIEDRDYFGKIQFLWTLGPESAWANRAAAKAVSKKVLPNVVNPEAPPGEQIKVSGWIGTVEKPGELEDNDNVIVLLARGKLIQEDVLGQFQEAGIYANYIVGELHADFLDEDDEDDIVTSDRQRIKEDDPRYEMLKSFLIREVIAAVRKEWTELRRQDGVRKIRTNPVLSEWLGQYQGDLRNEAETMLAKIETFKFQDEEGKKELFKASVLAFERLALRSSISKLATLESQQEFETLAHLFADIDELEAAHYYQIVKTRLEVLKKFESILPGAKERVIQDYLFNHLWLLDPSWERASTNRRIEESVGREFAAVTDKLTPDQRAGRLDIRYKTAAGKHIIIELKKYDRPVGIFELSQQVGKYISALRTCLREQYQERDPNIEAICVIGAQPIDEDDSNRDILKSMRARYITYDVLISQTQESYAEYLQKEKEIQRIEQLVERLVAKEEPEAAAAPALPVAVS